MTELEIIKHAKNYLDQLANGINPLTGCPVSPDDIINEPRLSRCFFFVSDVLGRVVENGGVEPKPRCKRLPFALPREARTAFPFSDIPIPITELAKRISSLKPDPDMKNLTYAPITDWLVQNGLLEIHTSPEGKHSKFPTSEGFALGISTEDRVSANGPYTAILYNRSMQEYILEHLDEITAPEPEHGC